jgi:hypothetical protein
VERSEDRRHVRRVVLAQELAALTVRAIPVLASVFLHELVADRSHVWHDFIVLGCLSGQEGRPAITGRRSKPADPRRETTLTWPN